MADTDLSSLPVGESGGGEPQPTRWVRHELGRSEVIEARRSSLSTRPEQAAPVAEAPAPPEPEPVSRGARAVQLAREARARRDADRQADRQAPRKDGVSHEDARVIATFHAEVDKWAADNAGPATKAFGEHRQIARYIADTYANTGRLASVQQARDAVEAHYRAAGKAVYDKYAPLAEEEELRGGADHSDARPMDERERLRRARAVLDQAMRRQRKG